jgi:hypothetical protein
LRHIHKKLNRRKQSEQRTKGLTISSPSPHFQKPLRAPVKKYWKGCWNYSNSRKLEIIKSRLLLDGFMRSLHPRILTNAPTYAERPLNIQSAFNNQQSAIEPLKMHLVLSVFFWPDGC